MTNHFMQGKWSWIEGSNMMRTALIDLLSDADLKFNPGGQNSSLGVLVLDFGNIEHAYVESLKTFQTDFLYRNLDAGMDSSVTRLKTWFQSMDDEMKALVSAFSDEDLKKPVGRSSGNTFSVETQVEVYLQALLIFFGKAVIYFRAMNRALPPSIEEWIA